MAGRGTRLGGCRHRPACPLRLVLVALTHAFRPFITFFFPQLCSQIDWSARPRFRDKELAAVGVGDAPDVMVADKLVEVGLHGGSVQWVLIHIEVQAQRDTSLASRVLNYNYRISRSALRGQVAVGQATV